MEDESIDETNYRRYARKAIERYHKKNMMADAFFWSHIIGLYERELKKAKK